MPTAALIGGTLSLQAYVQLISDLYRIHFKIENYLDKTLKASPALAVFYQKKLPWLEDDLMAMGVGLPSVSGEIQAPPQGEAALAGMMYVLEGSTLGGQVILKGLNKNGVLIGLPNRYYSGYGQLTGPKWRMFLEILEAVVQPNEVALAVEGANFTFKFFIENLKRG